MCKLTSENYMFIHLQKCYFWERIQISIFIKLSRLDKLQIFQRSWLPLLKYSTGWTCILMFHNLFACIIYNANLRNLHWNAHIFILFYNSFLHSMHWKIIYCLSNPLIYELIIAIHPPLIYALMIRGGGKHFPPLIIDT